jgi:hypothetical protein
MKTYRVTVTREVAQTKDLEIGAESEDDAREEAESEVGNIAEDEWSYDDLASDPEITEVVELSDDEEEDDELENKTAALA